MSSILDAATSSGSLTNQGLSGRAAQKLANVQDKKKKSNKKDIYPTVAAGSSFVPYIDPQTYNADYYRFGKFTPDGANYDIPPKRFDPFVNDKTPSSIRVVGQDAKRSSPADLIPAYTKFILEGVQESHTERSQIVETFGDFYVFMFGERPPVYNFSGQLINTKNANWVIDFMFMYNEYLRGTRCVERNAKLLLTYGGRQISGLMLNMATTTNAATEGGVGVQFSVVVFERTFYNFSEDTGYYTSDNKSVSEDEKLRKTLGLIAGKEGKGTSEPKADVAMNVTKEFTAGRPATGLIEGTSSRMMTA